MRRLSLLFLLTAILLSACTSQVTLLPLRFPTAEATLAPAPTATRLPPTPTVTPDPYMGVNPEAMRGSTVTVWHGLDGASASLLVQMAAEFSLVNPWGITISVVGYGDLTGLEQAIDNGEKGPGLPDVALALPEQLQGWQSNGDVIDLSMYVSNTEFGFAPTEVDDFPAAFWAQDVMNGQRSGVPAVRTARFIFYNVSLARKLGFTSAPQTAAEFREQACAANAAWRTDADESNDGYGGLAFDSNPWTVYSWLLAQGGGQVQDGQLVFDTPENKAVLDELLDLRLDGCTWLPTTLTNNEHLVKGTALFITGDLAEINDQAVAFGLAESADEWTVLAFPGEKPTILPYGLSYGVFESGPAQQLASWLFVRWMLSPENQARWATETGLMPVRSSALDLMKEYRAAHPQWAAALELLAQAQPYPQVAGWGMERTIFADGFDALFRYYPAYTVPSVLKMVDATIQDLQKP